MSPTEFRVWFDVYRDNFPDSPKLREVQWAATGGWICAAEARLRYTLWRLSPASWPKFPCPCCGYVVFREPPGSFDMCPICCWHDDLYALQFATTMDNGINPVTLEEAQRSADVRRAAWFHRRDRRWRMIDRSRDSFPEWTRRDFTDPWPERKSRDQLYYWLGRR
jgi:hypothetical protein